MKFETTPGFARAMDKADPLGPFRKEFHIPKHKGKKALYFCGNSLGLQPRSTSAYLRQELSDWAEQAVEGHFHAERPWLYYHHFSKKSLARLTGARNTEVVAMNQLTVNLHLLMTSFYRPTRQRFKLLMEAGAFSSDQYAVESQLKLHQLDASQALIEMRPRAGEHILRTEDILAAIQEHGSSLALVLFPGVQYYSGQRFDMGAITKAAHAVGAYAGFDLAHAIGNVPLQLHRDNVDFAVWCSYKYLNAGPGGVAGAFVHERHGKREDIVRLAGWWGHDEKERFKMKKGFRPSPGVDGWQLSNFPVLSGAALMASLELFDAAGMAALRKKSMALTGYLRWLLLTLDPDQQHFTIITPTGADDHGCQLSLLTGPHGKKLFDHLTKAGVIADWREPNVIRMAPVPLYNSFEDVHRLYVLLKESLPSKG